MRRIFAFVVFMLLVSISECAFARSLLTNCNIYQLGSEEFVIRLYGKNIPAPVPDLVNNSLRLLLKDTQPKNVKDLNASTQNYLSAIPLVESFNIEDISPDTAITIETTAPIKINDSSRSIDGYTMRIKTQKHINAFPPPIKTKTAIVYPETSLPFRVDARITVELRDAELRDILRMLMARIGRNIIIDPSLPSDILITMTLVDVRIDEVINYLMRMYDVACYSAGKNTVTFGTREGLFKHSGARMVKQFRISYAEPAQVSTLLKTLAALDDASITVDERARTLYIKTNPAKMEEAEDLISRIDTPMKQVMIHASIFEFNDTAAKDVENALNIVYDEWSKVDVSARGGIALEYNDLLRGKASGVERTIAGTFTALERKNKGKVLANPSVIAIDGQEASIKLTQDYTYVSGKDEAGNPTTETEEVGPQLTFTPRIERDGSIRLKIHIQTGDVIDRVSSGNAENLPVTSNRDVTTEIRVRDGMPFVIGGLFQDNQSKLVTRIPILGQIPLLGELFTYRSTEHTRTQAVMVVTPYILEN